MTVYIYALSDPRTEKVRYIGKTVQPKERLYMHLWYARKTDKQYHILRWIRTLLAEEVSPVMTIIEETTPELWQERERFWIAHYGGLTELTNITEGGDGIIAPRTEEWKKRIGDAHRGKKLTPEQCERFRQASHWAKATHCAKGHEYNEQNTIFGKNGHRFCLVCSREWQAKRRREKGILTKAEFEATRKPQEFCNRGHLMEGENLRIMVTEKRTERICRECVRLRNRESKERIRRPAGVRKKIDGFCLSGHELTPENTYLYMKDAIERKGCRECRKIAGRKRYQRKKEG